MNVLQHTRNERNPCYKQNRPDRSYRDTLLKSLKRISYLSTKELESIYFKLIIPHINYCISVWRNCSTSASETIEALHVKAARLIHRLPSSLEDHDVTKKLCRKRIVIKSRDYRAWQTWHHCIVHVIEPVRVNNDRKFLCDQKLRLELI